MNLTPGRCDTARAAGLHGSGWTCQLQGVGEDCGPCARKRLASSCVICCDSTRLRVDIGEVTPCWSCQPCEKHERYLCTRCPRYRPWLWVYGDEYEPQELAGSIAGTPDVEMPVARNLHASLIEQGLWVVPTRGRRSP